MGDSGARLRTRRYTDYLATFYKSRNKAAFERQKHEDAFKRKYDPFMFKEEVAQRSKTAQTTAVTVRAPPWRPRACLLCHLRLSFMRESCAVW